MANQDSFISEVSEEVRRDKLFALLKRYGWIAVLLVLVIVVGAAVFEWRKSQARAEAEAAGDAVIAALSAETPEARAEALAGVEVGEGPARRAIIALLRSSAAVETGNQETAIETLDTLAADTAVPALYRDLATLKALILGADTLTPDERIARLEPLSRAGNPFRLLALEQRALAEIELGNAESALDLLTGILADAEVTQDLRRRVTQLIVALGGTVPQQG